MAKKLRLFWLLHAVIWIVGAWLIFRLPWLLPSSRAVASDSYNLGFNNSVSTLAVGLIIVALCVLQLSTLNLHTKWRARLSRLMRPARFHAARRAEYLVPLGFSLLQGGALWWWFAVLPLRYFGEVDYPYSRTELVLLGAVPFRDFQWNYGPFLLYLPASMVRLSNYAISLDTAFISSIIITSTLGYIGTYYVIAQLRTAKVQRIALFLLLCLGFNIGLGAQHTYLRFMMPFIALFLFHRAVEKQNEPISGARRVGLCAWATFLCLLCFGVSPDNGVVFYAGLLFYCIGQFKAGARWFALCAIVSLAATGVLISLVSSHYFHSLISFGGGGANLPVYTTPYVVLYMATLFALVPFMGACAWKDSRRDVSLIRRNSGALMAALCAAAALLGAAALGRADASHVFTNGLIVFVLALAVVWRRSLGALYIGAFFLVFTVGANYSTWHLHKPIVRGAWAQKSEGRTKFDRDFFRPAFETRNPDLRAMKAQFATLQHVGIPLGAEEDMEIFLRYSGVYIVEHYPEPRSHVFTAKQLQEKLHDVEQMPYVLVSSEVMAEKPMNWSDKKVWRKYEKSQAEMLTLIFAKPILYEMKKSPFVAGNEVREYIKENFTKKAEIGPYYLLKNNAVK